MRDILFEIGCFLLLLIVFILPIFLLVAPLFYVLKSFNINILGYCFENVMIVVVACALLCTVVSYVLMHIKRKSKIRNYFSRHYSKFVFAYLFVVICLLSTKAISIWSYEEIKEIISLQWTIQGLAVTIYLVWHIIVPANLIENMPQLTKKKYLYSKMNHIKNKENYYHKVSVQYNSVYYLIISLLCTSGTTLSCYVFTEDLSSIWGENTIRFSLILSILTMLKLFFDVAILLRKEKKQLINDVKITENDIEEHNETQEKIEQVRSQLHNIDCLELSEDEKFRIKYKLLRKIYGKKELNRIIGIRRCEKNEGENV